MSSEEQRFKEYEDSLPHCGFCNKVLIPGSGRYRWCSQRCYNRNYYRNNKEYWAAIYQAEKKEYRRSGAERAGISFRAWRQLPDPFRKF